MRVVSLVPSATETLLAFGITPIACTRFGRRGPVSSFTDALGWYPGIEARGGAFTFRDQDGSVVIPSRRNQPYSTRVVDQNGDPVQVTVGNLIVSRRPA